MRLGRISDLLHGRHERRDIGDIADKRHSDNSRRADALRQEYRDVAYGKVAPQPKRPPGHSASQAIPEFRETPGPGEITLDYNSKEKSPRRILPSQSKNPNDSEHYYDGRVPFGISGPHNLPAPVYPVPYLPPTREEFSARHPIPEYQAFPHEKEAAGSGERGRTLARGTTRPPPANAARTPEPDDRRARFRDAVVRGLAAGAAGMGGGGYYQGPRC